MEFSFETLVFDAYFRILTLRGASVFTNSKLCYKDVGTASLGGHGLKKSGVACCLVHPPHPHSD